MCLNKRAYTFYLVFIIFRLIVNGEVSDEEFNILPKLFQLDDYDQCMALKEHALFCSINVELTPTGSHFSKVWSIIQEVNKSKRNYRHDWLRHGVCVPESCPELFRHLALYKHTEQRLQAELSECYTNKYKQMGLKATVTKLNCETSKPRHSADIYDTLVGIFVLFLIGIAIFASIYERLVMYEPADHKSIILRTKLQAVISCFSIPKNWKRLGSTNTNPDTDPLKCFDGMRFYITLFVILTHGVVSVCSSSVWNTRFIEQMGDDPGNVIILNGMFIIQSFFIMSAWLLSYHFLDFFETHKKVYLKYIIRLIIYRYIRLTPSLLVIIAINCTLLYHANRGPMWERTVGEEYRNCRANWWTNLLYINNYYDVKHICLPPTWYLAADIQLFILALIILTLMWKYQDHTKLILGIFFGIGTLIPGIITYINNYDFLIRHYPESLYQLDLDTPELTEMYMTGHTNIGACVTGLSWGYIYYKTRGQKLFTKKSHKVLCWILVWTVTLSIIFMGTPAFKNDLTYSRLEAAVYVALARNIFSLAVGLALFAWTQGTGGFLYSGVTCTPIRILGRLTYSVYLVHYPLIRVRSGTMRSPYYFSRYTNLIDAYGDIMMSFICGLMLCLFVELPTTALLKLVSSVPQQNKEIEAKKTE